MRACALLGAANERRARKERRRPVPDTLLAFWRNFGDSRLAKAQVATFRHLVNLVVPRLLTLNVFPVGPRHRAAFCGFLSDQGLFWLALFEK